VLYPVIRRFVR